MIRKNFSLWVNVTFLCLVVTTLKSTEHHSPLSVKLCNDLCLYFVIYSFFRYLCQINYRKYQQSKCVYLAPLFIQCVFFAQKFDKLGKLFFSLNAWMSYNFAIFRIKLHMFLICGINNLLELWLNMDHTSASMTSSRTSHLISVRNHLQKRNCLDKK